jgi:phosphate-selective porin OprO/OprP
MKKGGYNNKLEKAVAVLFSIAYAGVAMGEAVNEKVYEKLWGRVVLHDTPNNILTKLALTGRLQADYYNFGDSNAGSESDFNWRRFRVGLKASLFKSLTFHSEADMNLNDPNPMYNKLTDANLAWVAASGLTVKLGRQSAPFTLDGSTSSKKLYTLERSKLAGNIGFPKEYFTGISFSGDRRGWEYLAGLFSSDHGPEFGEAFNYGQFGLFTVGYNFKEKLKMDNALLRLDYVNQSQDAGNKTPHHKNAASLVMKLDKGNLHLWTDLGISDGYGGKNDIAGLHIMPFYDITDKAQLVFRYTYIKSSGGEGVRLSKYEKNLNSSTGKEANEMFLGANYYLYGHKLKWQNGIKYTRLSRQAGEAGYDGWGFTSGFRISW